VSFEFLSTSEAAPARSPMEREARAAGAVFERRDGWNVAVRFEDPQAERERCRAADATSYHLAELRLAAVARTIVAWTERYDAVLTPTLAQLPALVGGLRNDDDPPAEFAAQERFTPFAALWNMTGMPAVSLPLHWTSEGLPVGVMLASRPAQDHLLLALAAQVESAAPWHDRHPPCW